MSSKILFVTLLVLVTLSSAFARRPKIPSFSGPEDRPKFQNPCTKATFLKMKADKEACFAQCQGGETGKFTCLKAKCEHACNKAERVTGEENYSIRKCYQMIFFSTVLDLIYCRGKGLWLGSFESHPNPMCRQTKAQYG